MKKKIVVGLILVVIGGVVCLVLFRGSSNRETIDPRLIVSPIRQEIKVTVRETGQVEPLTQVEIKSKIPGQVAALFVDEGDAVTAGAKLLDLDRTQYRYAADRAKAAYDEALIREEYATLALKRKEKEVQATSAAIQELDLAKVDMKLAALAVQREKLAWDAAKDDLEHCQIRSPIDGVVIHRGVETGEMVTPGVDATVAGKPLLTVADLSRLVVKTNLNQIDLARVVKDQTVQIRFDAIPERVFEGRVRTIAPAAQQATGSVNLFAVEILIQGADVALVKPGMTADIEILVAAKADALTIPVEAVRVDQGKASVTVVQGTPPQATTAARDVTTGLQNDRLVEITAGLDATDRILLKPKSAADNELVL